MHNIWREPVTQIQQHARTIPERTIIGLHPFKWRVALAHDKSFAILPAHLLGPPVLMLRQLTPETRECYMVTIAQQFRRQSPRKRPYPAHGVCR
jgi:hypothetical protein